MAKRRIVIEEENLNKKGNNIWVEIEDDDGSLIRHFRDIRVPSRGETLQAVEHVGRRVRAGRKPCATRALLSSMGQSRRDELS